MLSLFEPIRLLRLSQVVRLKQSYSRATMAQQSGWLKNPVKGILCDITGVLYESASKVAIPGSIEAIRKIRQARIPFRLLTNETQHSVSHLVSKLNSFGFDFQLSEVIAPAPVVRRYLLKHNLRPYLLVFPDVLCEFEGVSQEDPNCVVIGDASVHFTYEATNKAFQLLMKLKERETQMTEVERRSMLISMGKNRFYKEHRELVIDLGAYTTALEYACDLKCLVLGKPSGEVFRAALADLGHFRPEEVVMIGDDIIGDVKGSQDSGMRGVLVRSGKFRKSDECHPAVKPNAIVDNLNQAVDQIIAAKS